MYTVLKKIIERETDYIFEILFADNGSTDSSVDIMKSISNNDKQVKLVINQTNFGPERSSINLWRHASGDAIIGLPCDFQDPPEMIHDFIRHWEDGYEIVLGQKLSSKENPIKYACRKAFYSIIKAFSEHNEIEQIDGFGLYDKRVYEQLLITAGQDPYYNVRNLVAEYGYNIKLLPYEQAARQKGKSSYNIYSYFVFAITSLCNTSVKPLHFMTIVGTLCSLGSVFVAIFYLVYKLMHWQSFSVGMAPMVIGLFFLSGVQLFCLGILGEYVSILIRRVTNKPIVIEKELVNFDEENK